MEAQTAESQAEHGTVVAQLTTAEACVQCMKLEAVAVDEAASDLCTKVPGHDSAHPRASVKSAEPRHPKPLTGEGSQDQAGVVCRFTNSLNVYFSLAIVDSVHQLLLLECFLKD